MAIQILMPALSPTMTEGTLATWIKQEGEKVAPGDVIAEIETDKATMEVEAVDEGTLGKILIQAGTEGVAVNTPIAVLLEDGEDSSAIDAAVGGTGGGGEAPAQVEPKAEVPPQEAPKAAEAPAPSPALAPAVAQDGARVFASPLARRLAAEAGLDLSRISGSGPNGRIVKKDVESAQAAPKPAAQPTADKAAASAATPAPAPAAAPQGVDAKAMADQLGMTYRAEKTSGMRKVIARRLSESKQTVPHFYLTVDYKLDALLALRKQLNDQADGKYKLSVNDFIIKANALALKAVPAANASFADSEMLYYDHADISVAVATPTGLITPIIKKAEQKGLQTISAEMKDLAARARDGKLKPEEYQGGTFSLSNLGMFGVREFAAIINPPQGCILAVGAGEQRAVVEGGEVKVATMMTCTLSVDHRVVDGAVGAEYLQALRTYVEEPLKLML